MTTLHETIDTIRDRVDPTPAEREALASTTAALTERVNDALATLGIDASVIQTGSTARDTYMAGDKDIDLFIQFPTTMTPDELETAIRDIGHTVLPDSTEAYASHPYIQGTLNGFDIDLVPCYDIDDPSAIQSAVDRTPFHTEYLEARLTDALAADVRVAKYFLTETGIYGSDTETQGFSGYLTELLILEAGGFPEFLQLVADWTPPVVIDPADHDQGADTDLIDSTESPLVVRDPVDPFRNVADVVSVRQVARLQHHARHFRANPSLAYFSSTTPTLDAAEIQAAFEARETTPLAVVFDRPDELREDLAPQLQRSCAGMTRLLTQARFPTLRTTWFLSADTAVLFAEVTVPKRAGVTNHRGPPVEMVDVNHPFLETYPLDEENVYINDDGHYVVEQPADAQTPADVLRDSLISDAAHGASIEPALTDGYTVVSLTDPDAGHDLAADFAAAFSDYLHPQP